MIFHSKIPVGVLIQTFLRAIKIDQGLWPFPRHKYCRVQSLHCPGVEKVGEDHRFVPLMARKYERYLWTWIFMVHPTPSTTTIWGWYSTLIDGNIGDWLQLGLPHYSQWLNFCIMMDGYDAKQNAKTVHWEMFTFDPRNHIVPASKLWNFTAPMGITLGTWICDSKTWHCDPYYPYPNQIMNLHRNRNQMGWFGPLSSSCSPVKNLGP